MYSNAYQYITNRISESDVKNLKEWKDAFNLANIPSSVIDRTYHIYIPSISISAQNDTLKNHNINVQLNYFRKGFRNTRTVQLEALDEAFCLIQAIINPLKWNDPETMIYKVNCDQVSQSPIDDSNDNLMRIQMDFSLTMLVKTIS